MWERRGGWLCSSPPSLLCQPSMLQQHCRQMQPPLHPTHHPPTCTTSSTPTQPERRGEMKSGSSSVDCTCGNAMQCNAMRECHEGELHMRRGCALLRAAASVMVCAAATGPLLLAPLQGTAARAPQATPAKPGDVPGTAAPPPCEGTAAWRTAARCSTSPAAVVRVGGAGKAAGQARCSSSSSCTLQHVSGCNQVGRGAVAGHAQQTNSRGSRPIQHASQPRQTWLDSSCHPAASNHTPAAAAQPAATHPTSELVYTRPGAPRLVGRATSVPKAKRHEMQRNNARRSPMPATQKGRPCMEGRVQGAALSGQAARKRGGGSHKPATENGGRAGCEVGGVVEGPGAVGRRTQQPGAGGAASTAFCQTRRRQQAQQHSMRRTCQQHRTNPQARAWLGQATASESKQRTFVFRTTSLPSATSGSQTCEQCSRAQAKVRRCSTHMRC